jgi:ankyrin repeat protein
VAQPTYTFQVEEKYAIYCGRGNVDIIKSILSYNDVNINTQNNGGWTAPMVASHSGHDAVVKLLLSQTDIAVNTQGWTALMLASVDAVVKLLLSRTDIAVNTGGTWSDGTRDLFPEWPGHNCQTSPLSDRYLC